MKKQIHTYLLIVISLLVVIGAQAQELKTLAFAGAEGYGAYASGGRGGETYLVTNLNDSGAGSFREAVSKSGRTIIFTVGGVVKINSKIKVAPNITIAGQTAPGSGITIFGHGVSFSSNNIVRYIRFRGSNEMARGSCTVVIDSVDNAIFDHVSISWGRWDNLHIKATTNVTLQYCIISEAIEPQMFGALIERPRNITIHHCLWADNSSRNPKGKAVLEYVNNVIYNWRTAGFVGGHSEADHYQDLINNYFIAGPNSSESFISMFSPTDHVYHSGNLVDMNRDGKLDGRLIVDDDFRKATATIMAERGASSPKGVVAQTPQQAYAKIVAEVGASNNRDTIDKRVISQLTSLGTKGAIISTIDQVGGMPMMEGGKYPTDKNNNGIPDTWEKKHKLDLADPKAASQFSISTEYTNLELYINSIVKY